jgi:gluconokinase
MNQIEQVVIAVDIGTTSTKALAVDLSGAICQSHAIGYPLHTPQPGYAEQDPEQILEAVVECIAAVMRKGGWRAQQVRCVTFSSANHSLILMDRHGNALTPVITWADLRSATQAERLLADGSGLRNYLRTGTPIHPMSPLVKLLWMQEEAPDRFEAAHQFIGIKEYIFHRLFGIYVTDYSMASATGLFNLSTCRWDAEALQLAGIRDDQLPELRPTTDAVSGLKAVYAERMGLAADTPFVLGAQDGVLANLGIGAVEDGIAAVTIGTSSAVRTAVEVPVLEPRGRLFCYALTDRHWIVGGASNNGAIVAQWMAERVCRGRPMDEVLQMAASVPPGSDGLLFLPLLSGERAPFWDGHAKGVLFGLTLAHSEHHMIRAAMEGVLYQISAIVALMEQCGRPAREIRASGGFARSSLWCQMLSDMLGVPVTVPDSVESSGLGAAQLGLYAMDGCEGPLHRWKISAGTIYTPDSHAHEIYRQWLPFYLNLYHGLKANMREAERLANGMR